MTVLIKETFILDKNRTHNISRYSSHGYYPLAKRDGAELDCNLERHIYTYNNLASCLYIRNIQNNKTLTSI